MLEYLQINAILFALCCLALFSLRSAPARLRFHVTIISVCIWFVPWGALNISIPDAVPTPIQKLKIDDVATIRDFFDEPVTIEAHMQRVGATGDYVYQDLVTDKAINQDIQQGNTISGIFAAHSTLATLVSLLFGIGALLFIKEIWAYHQSLSAWRKRSEKADNAELESRFGICLSGIEVRVLKGAGPGMATGIRRPIIWISNRIQNPENVKTILLHERMHISSKDIYWVWLLTFAGKLFWWNPMVMFCCRKARELIEFSCDERCNALLQEGKYKQSLAQIILQSNQYDGGLIPLGMQESKSFNVMRVKALASAKALRRMHVLAAVLFLMFGGWISMVFASDRLPSQLSLPFAEQDAESSAKLIGAASIRISAVDEPLFHFMSLVRSKKYAEAQQHYKHMQAHYDKQGTLNESRKIELFRAIAAMYGDLDQYEKVIETFQQQLRPESGWQSREVSRILAVAYIKLGQYQQAKDILEKSESLGYRGDPTRALLAQAYHLVGEYEKSNRLIENAFQLRGDSMLYSAEVAMLKLKGKNLLLLGQLSQLQSVRDALGRNAPNDFAQVSVTDQQIPYLYFFNRQVSGADIAGFDSQIFPMPALSADANHPELRKILEHVIRISDSGRYLVASAVLEQGTEKLLSKLSMADQVRVLEYDFMLNLAGGRKYKVIELAKQLANSPGDVHPSIRARSYFTLASGRSKLRETSMAYFNKYLSMLGEPTLASDHELLNRYFWLDNDSKAKPSLERVAQFYEQHNAVPDIRVLNRLIRFYDGFGDQEKTDHYRKLFKREYNRAIDFMMESAENSYR